MHDAQTCDLSCRLNSACDCIYILRSMVEVMGNRAGLNDSETNRMVLAVDELFANISRHGYCGESGDVEMHAELKPAALCFAFRDFAAPIVDKNELKAMEWEAMRPGGLGLHLIHSVVDEFHHEALPDGNRWELVRHLPRGKHHET